MDLNDKRHFSGLGTSADFAKYIVDSFDVLYEEGAAQGRVMCISLHPFLVGTPNRIDDLRRAFAHIAEHREAWWATGADVLDTYKTLVGVPQESNE
jgi:allantoinase